MENTLAKNIQTVKEDGELTRLISSVERIQSRQADLILSINKYADKLGYVTIPEKPSAVQGNSEVVDKTIKTVKQKLSSIEDTANINENELSIILEKLEALI